MTDRPATAAPATLRSAGWYANYVLLVLFLANAFNAIDRAVVGVLLEPIKTEMGVSDTAMGLLTGLAFVAFYSLFGIPIARWADRGVRRSILSLGVLVWSGMTALCGLATSFTMLLLARIGVGAGEASCFPTALPLIADYFRRELRAKAIAIFQSALYFGVVLGTILVAWITQLYGWRAAFLALGIPGMLLALLIRLTVREPARGAQEDAPVASGAPPPSLLEAWRGILAERAFVFLLAGMTLMSMVSSILGAWGPAFLIRIHGLSIAQVGSVLGPAIGIGGVIGAIAGGALASRLARRTGDERWAALLPAIAAFCAVPTLTLFLFADALPFALLAAGMSALLNSVYMGPAMAAALGLVAPSTRSLAASTILVAQNLIGWGLGPLVVGLVSDGLRVEEGAGAIRYALLTAPAAGVLAGSCLLLAYTTLPRRAAGALAQPGASPSA